MHNFPHTACKRVQQLNSNTMKGHKQIFQFLTIRVWHLVSDSAYYFQNCDIFIEVQSFCFYCTQGSIHRPSCHPLTPSPPEPIVLILYCQPRGRNYAIVMSTLSTFVIVCQTSHQIGLQLKASNVQIFGEVWRKPVEPQAKQGLDPFRINL